MVLLDFNMLSVVYAVVFGKARLKNSHLPRLLLSIKDISFSYISNTHKQPKDLGYVGRGKLIVVAIFFMNPN